MQVLIENERILIDRNVLEYYPYYFSIWREGSDHRLTVKSVLSQWATALDTLPSRKDPVYLPYYLDDQTCRYLKAELDGEDVVLTDLLVRDDGWDVNLDDLSTRLYSAPEVLTGYVDINGPDDSSPKFFERFKAEELIEALRNAELGPS